MKVEPNERAEYFAALHQGKVYFAGKVEPGQAVAAPDLISAPDENDFLGAVAGKGSDYDPLPDTGKWCEAGQIYGYNGGLVICRQSHNRTIYTPEQTPSLFSVYRPDGGTLEWVANEPVVVGTRRTYDGVLYECIQAHVTQADWTPPAVPNLWRVVEQEPTTDAWAIGVSYKIGDKVTYNGRLYECRQAHTSQAGWTPPAVPALWLDLGPV